MYNEEVEWFPIKTSLQYCTSYCILFIHSFALEENYKEMKPPEEKPYEMRTNSIRA